MSVLAPVLEIALVKRADLIVSPLPQGFVTDMFHIPGRCSDGVHRPRLDLTGSIPKRSCGEELGPPVAAELVELGEHLYPVSRFLRVLTRHRATLRDVSYAWGVVDLVRRGKIRLTSNQGLVVLIDSGTLWMANIFQSLRGGLAVHLHKLTAEYNLPRGTLLIVLT